MENNIKLKIKHEIFLLFCNLSYSLENINVYNITKKI